MKSNVFEFKDGYIVGWASNTNNPFYLDYEDWDKVKNRSWHEDHSKNGYIATSIGSGKKEYLHKLIMGKDGIVDHKNRNRLDNRRQNLRLVTKQENACNRSIHKNNNSGKSGVSWNKNAKKWEAKLRFKGKVYGRKYFEELEEAVKHREKLEDIYLKDIYIRT